MDELTREFLIESQEGLDRMERCLTDLEERPGDTALLAEIFRSVHTIKGTTGFLGFKRLEKLAHSGENLLGLLREGKAEATADVITGLLQLLDGLRCILKTVEASGTEGDGADAELIGRLEELQQPAQAVSAANRKANARKAEKNADSALMSATPLQAPAVAAQVEVKPEQVTPEPAKEAVAHPPAGADEGRVQGTSTAESTLRVDVSLLNRMMNLVGELVLTRNQVLQATAGDPNMTLLSRRLDMVTADLRESVMKARMQPVSNVFSKMPRIVRDLSHTLGRRVRLQMEGQETELDKSLLEAIKDPLTHAVRNSLDHGIEPPDVREAAGKDPEGMLRLRAVQEGSHVIIEVADDGAGMSVERIRNKAIERGLLTAERASLLSERELLQLVFLPGFSTASAVTNVSGRGVGMDVVRTNVEKIGGKVELDSRFGKGTTMRLRIPLTLAIIPALIVRCAEQSYALPQAALSELVHVPESNSNSAIEWIDNAPLYRLRGKLLPLVFLDGMLNPAAGRNAGSARSCFIAVLDADGRRFGLAVDGLNDPEEIVVKPLSAALKGIGLYSGATVLGNGELALILDPGSIAMKAGVTMNADEDVVATSDTETLLDETDPEFLVVEICGRRAGVQVSEVLRIEQVPVSRVEYIGYRAVLNFDGQILPVEDSGNLLGAAEGNPEAQIVVVICREGNRHVGIAVSQVLDVARGADIFEAGTHARAVGVVNLKERVTSVVDLGSVAKLPVDMQTDAGEWNQMAEAVQ
ncbi:MAG: chemotaxis protein CheW [Acidobacteriota bacterium]|nr:chemotaxis protein CheW [Acidobacteriota bacterium]